MMAFRRAFTLLLSASTLLANADAQSTTPPSFVQTTDAGNISFAVAAVQDVGDLYFHVEAPASASWVAFGIGSDMKGSLMWVMYRNSNGTGVTLSSRTMYGEKHGEPSYNPNIDCSLIAATELNDTSMASNPSNVVAAVNGKDTFVVNAHCRNITNIPFDNIHTSTKRTLEARKNKKPEPPTLLNLTNTQQSFIFALGPTNKHLSSDATDAGIRRHSVYGQFTMDMAAATSALASLVTAVDTWENSNAQLVSGPKNDSDWIGAAHGLLMIGTFVLLWPTGVIFLRVLERVKWHAWIQGVGMGLVVVGFVLAMQVGSSYNHSKDVNNPHQILGIVLFIATLTQFGLGYRHHMLYKRTHLPTILGRIHRYMGPLLLFVGALNGFFGYNFSGAGSHNKIYAPLFVVVLLGLVGTLGWVEWRKRRGIWKGVGQKAAGERAVGSSHVSGGAGQRSTDGVDVALGDIHGERRVEPRAMV